MPVDPDRPCPHENFAADVAVNRIGQDDPGNDSGLPTHYSADIQVSPLAPTSSADQTELRAPLCPASSGPAMEALGAVLRGPYEL